jgi:hypothetical protein
MGNGITQGAFDEKFFATRAIFLQNSIVLLGALAFFLLLECFVWAWVGRFREDPSLAFFELRK